MVYPEVWRFQNADLIIRSTSEILNTAMSSHLKKWSSFGQFSENNKREGRRERERDPPPPKSHVKISLIKTETRGRARSVSLHHSLKDFLVMDLIGVLI